MKMSFATRSVLALVLSAASTLASAQTVPCANCVLYDDGDRYFEFVPAAGISWANAEAAAKNRSHLGVQGQLATIRSEPEELFIRSLMPAFQGNRTQVWVGGSEGNCPVAGPGEPEPPACWGTWLNGGVILAQDNPEGFTRESPYTNWQTGQPDNSNNATKAAYGPGADGFFGINDVNKGSDILGYFVEYGDSLTPFPAVECLTGCNLTEGEVPGSVLTLPSTAIIPSTATVSTAISVAGGQYEVRTWLVQDDASRCGLPDVNGIPEPGEGTQKDLDLLVDPGNPGIEAKLPGYTCANPALGYLLIIKTTSGVQVPSGTVDVEMFTNNLLPTSFPCHLQIPRNGNPTHEDIGLFQYDDWEDMVEEESFEATYGCRNPGKVRGGSGSWWTAGAVIDFGDADPYTGFLALTQYKLKWALEAVNRAVAQGVVTGGDGTKLRNEILVATSDITKGNITECRKHVVNFLKFARATKYSDSLESDTNWNGEFLMRGDNLLWTLVKLTAAKQFVAQ